jgi:cysteinyl-tRNA synthetase
MLAVLGIDPEAPQWAGGRQASAEHQALDLLIQGLIAQRKLARENKDFAGADQIRDQLTNAGISLSDSADKTYWSING